MWIHLNFKNGQLIWLGWQACTFSLSTVDSHRPAPNNREAPPCLLDETVFTSIGWVSPSPVSWAAPLKIWSLGETKVSWSVYSTCFWSVSHALTKLYWSLSLGFDSEQNAARSRRETEICKANDGFWGPSPNPRQSPFNLEPGKRISPLPSARLLWKPVCLLKDSCMHSPAQTSNPPCPLIKPDLLVWMCGKGIMNTC